MNKLRVFYDPRQSVARNKSFSPSAGKPALVVEEWQKRNYPIEIMPVTPVTREDFYLVHDKDHVDAILNLEKPNGFNNTLPEVAAALHWTSGSMVAAAQAALELGVNTVSPTSGFHHAEYYSASGFCTFNGLMLAAVKLKEMLPKGKKIGILDIDMHYGNGTVNIIHHLSLYDTIRHYTFGGEEPFAERWHGDKNGDEWLARLPGIVQEFQDCAVVLYQAGADPHAEDPFGGALSNIQLRERDRIVFTGMKKMEIPVAWNLAGGYQEPIQKVLDIHNATIEECLKVMNQGVL